MAATNSKPTNPRFKDITGLRFGRWTVIDYERSTKGLAYWRCKCECGAVAVISGGNLRNGISKSCGCLRRDSASSRRTHSNAVDPEYVVWRGMRQRCHNPNSKTFASYGGRGIVVCDRWRTSFANFLADMGVRPTAEHEIERKNNDGNYEPSNCIWALRPTQLRNTRRSRLYSIGKRTMCLKDWSNELHIPYLTLWSRLKTGMSFDRAISRRFFPRIKTTH